MLEYLINLLYPRRCPICGDIASPRGSLACPSCKTKVKLIEEPRCKSCSKGLEFEEQEYCYDCETKKYHYTYGISLWEYDEIMQKSIAAYKYKGRREYADFYIEEFIKYYADEIIKIDPDLIVPIPIHRSKLKTRGYNQAEVLSTGISKALGVASSPNLLLRDKKTLPQKQLNDKERLINLQKAFSFSNKEYKRLKRTINKVLLVDDIYTTGSTIEACTKILLDNGIKEVFFISVCIGKGF